MKKISSTNFENQQLLHEYCDAAFTISLISGRWKLSILNKLHEGVNRFSALKAGIPAITDRVLALQLKEMETSGLLVKFSSAGTGRDPVYSLSDTGKSMLPIIADLANWSKANRAGLKDKEESFAHPSI